MRIQQSLCYPMYQDRGTPLDDLCRAVAQIGYRAIELWGWDQTLGEIVETARRHGLVVASMCGHASLGDGLNKGENHERIEGELVRSIERAAELGIPGLICFSGNRHPGQSDLAGMVVCAQGLRRVVRLAEEKGVNLNVELLNSRVDHPGYQCDHTDWGLALCEMVGSPRVRLLYDIYHMQIMEGDVIRHIRRAIHRIGHFHTAGNPDRRDMDDQQELNYRGICSAIAATGYDLYVGHEFRPKGDKIEALRTAFTLCDQEG
ncbi:MAG: TIM barrel protein [Candidatus Latescibacterota bacterium]